MQDALSETSSSKGQTDPCRGLWRGIATYLLSALAGGFVGVAGELLVRFLSNMQLEDLGYIQYEMTPIAILGLPTILLLGAYHGWRSERGAARAIRREWNNPPFFTRLCAETRRGLMAMPSMYLVPRWELLVGVTNQLWRIFPKVLIGIIVAGSLLLPMYMKRDSDFRLSLGFGAGFGIWCGDCFLVNQIARWRMRQQGVQQPTTEATG